MAFNIQKPTTVKGGYSEILKYPVGDGAIASIVIDASTIVPDSDGVRILKAGTLLTKNASNQYQRYLGSGVSSSDTNEVQVITLTSATGGTFNVTFNGSTASVEIAYNAAASAVQSALEGLDTLSPGDVAVTGSAGGPYTVTFGGDQAGKNVAALVATDNLTPGPATVVVTTSTGGSEGVRTIAGVLAYDVEVYDAEAHSDAPAAMFFHEAVFRADRIVDYVTYGTAAKAALPTCLFQ